MEGEEESEGEGQIVMTIDIEKDCTKACTPLVLVWHVCRFPARFGLLLHQPLH